MFRSGWRYKLWNGTSNLWMFFGTFQRFHHMLTHSVKNYIWQSIRMVSFVRKQASRLCKTEKHVKSTPKPFVRFTFRTTAFQMKNPSLLFANTATALSTTLYLLSLGSTHWNFPLGVLMASDVISTGDDTLMTQTPSSEIRVLWKPTTWAATNTNFNFTGAY